MTKPTGQKLPLNALLRKPLRNRRRTTSLGSHATSVSLDMGSLKFGPSGLRKTQRLGPCGTNPPTSSRPLGVVVSDQAARDLLIRSRFQLCSFYHQVYFRFDCTKKEREKLAEARQELKARREKGERGLIIQGLVVVEIQRPYLWRDPLIIHAPAPPPTRKISTGCWHVQRRFPHEQI